MAIKKEQSTEAVKNFEKRMSYMNDHRTSLDETYRKVNENFRMKERTRSFRETRLSSLRTALTFSHTLSIGTRNFLELYNADPLIGVKRTPGTDETKARIHEVRLNYDLQRIENLPQKLYEFTLAKVKNGYCAFKFIPLNGGVPFTGFDFIPIHRENFWWDPLSSHTLEDARDVIYRVQKDRTFLERMAAMNEQFGEGVGYDFQAVQEILAILDKNPPSVSDPRGVNENESNIVYPPHRGVFNIYEHWWDDALEVICEIGNERYLVRPKEWGNPLQTERAWGMKKPFGMAVEIPLLEEITGIGVGESLLMPQEEIDTKHNQFVDLQNRILNRQSKVRKGALDYKAKRELTNPSPNGLLELDELSDVEDYGIDVGSARVVWEELKFLDDQANEGTGNYPSTRGAPSQTKETATAFAGTQAAAAPRHATRLLLDGHSVLVPIAKMALWYYREYMVEPEMVEIVGEDGEMYDEFFGATNADPGIGLIPLPSISTEPKIVTVQNLLKFFELLSNSGMFMTGQADLFQTVQIIGREMNIRDLHKILPPGGGNAAMMQLLQQIQGQGGAGGEQGQMTRGSPEADNIAKIFAGAAPRSPLEGLGGGRPTNGRLG
jgi:hypothetical protein